MYKVKKQETIDVVVTDIQPGAGKYVGKMGALITSMGKVGTGFSDKQREAFNDTSVIGRTIEVGCMEVTKDNKFRHPRFIRFRPDKDKDVE
jgi:ATP-dependent DNA ligase